MIQWWLLSTADGNGFSDPDRNKAVDGDINSLAALHTHAIVWKERKKGEKVEYGSALWSNWFSESDVGMGDKYFLLLVNGYSAFNFLIVKPKLKNVSLFPVFWLIHYLSLSSFLSLKWEVFFVFFSLFLAAFSLPWNCARCYSFIFELCFYYLLNMFVF